MNLPGARCKSALYTDDVGGNSGKGGGGGSISSGAFYMQIITLRPLVQYLFFGYGYLDIYFLDMDLSNQTSMHVH